MKQKKLHLIFLSCLVTASVTAQKVVPANEFGNAGTFKTTLNLSEAFVQNQLVQPDGKILVSVTYTDDFGYTTAESLYRITTAGKVDKDFGKNGIIAIGKGAGKGLIRGGYFDLQPDGKIVTANVKVDRNGIAPNVIVIERFLPSGHVDSLFGKNGVITFSNNATQGLNVTSVKVKPDGKIILTGSYSVPFTLISGSFIFELNYFGLFVSSFGNNGIVFPQSVYTSDIRKLLVLPDNNFVTANVYYDSVKQQYSTCLAFYKADGSIDSSKGVDGIALNHNPVLSDVTYNIFYIGLALQSDGKILEYTSRNNSDILYRYKKNSRIDISYGTNGKAITGLSASQHAVRVQDNQKSLSDDGNVIKRCMNDGTPDLNFGDNGTLSFPQMDMSFGFCFNEKRLYGVGTTYNFNTGFPLLEVTAYNFCDSCGAPEPVAANETTNMNAKVVAVKVYPNPVTDKVLISGLSNKTTTQLQLTDGAGRILKTAITANNIYEWNIKNLPAGLYFIKVFGNKQQSYSFKILKQ